MILIMAFDVCTKINMNAQAGRSVQTFSKSTQFKQQENLTEAHAPMQ